VWHVTQVANLLNEEIPQIFTLCGRGPRSTLRLLRPGLAVTEMAVSPLPGNPTAVWTIKRSMLDEFDAYIIVSFTNATLVRHCLSREQSAVEAASPECGISDILQCQHSRSMLLDAMCSECKTLPWEAQQDPQHHQMATALHGSSVAVCTFCLSTTDPVLPTCCCCADSSSVVCTLFNTELACGRCCPLARLWRR